MVLSKIQVIILSTVIISVFQSILHYSMGRNYGKDRYKIYSPTFKELTLIIFFVLSFSYFQKSFINYMYT